MTTETFTCCMCGVVFAPTWDPAKVRVEWRRQFAGTPMVDESIGVICAECHRTKVARVDGPPQMTGGDDD